MAVKDTIQIGDPRLKASNQVVKFPLNTHIKSVIKDLIDTMHENRLIGMAAQQIGENYTLFVTQPRNTPTRSKDQSDLLRVYINPVIDYFSPEEVIIFEGCGSVAHGTLFAPVSRPKTIRITYTNEQGHSCWLRCDGILSRVIQHEYDHLQGIEFTEKIADSRLMMDIEWYRKYAASHPELTAVAQITIKDSNQLE
jgi:peptide deformylase